MSGNLILCPMQRSVKHGILAMRECYSSRQKNQFSGDNAEPSSFIYISITFSFRHWGLGGRGVTERAETCTAHLGKGDGIF